MGSVVRKITRPIKKLIPKEIKPFLPYAAAAFGAPYLAGSGIGSLATFATKNPALTKALIAGTTAGVTDDNANILRTAALAAAPDLVQGGLRTAGSALTPNKAEILKSLESAKIGSSRLPIGQEIGSMLTRAADSNLVNLAANPTGRERLGGVMDVAKVAGTQASIDQAAKLAEINQDEIDKYNEELRQRGVLDKTKRRSSIFNIYQNAGYDADYINSMLDRYGYESGGLTSLRVGYKNGKKVTTMEDLISGLNKDDDDDDFNNFLMTAKEGVEAAYKTPGPKPVPMLKFAQGGEVEIEEETDDLGIMDFMRDQGIEYGEQASYGFDDAMGESFEMFQDYRKRGLIPLEMEFDEFLEIMRDSKKSKDGIMQMASGYKTDIEEMYEQYVFEMEEQGLQPMSFSDFLAQARAGMADGGEVSIDKIEMLIKKGADNDLIKTYVEGSQDGVIDQIRESMKKKQNKADGGIMEKDMRGGGFIPEGTKERADDVPARLSKNEFVMTADAVRAAGGGSVNQGAKRMYDMMYQLEGKV